MILHVVDLGNVGISAVRSGCHGNDIHLDSSKESLSFDGFERVFARAVGLRMIDFTRLDKK